MRCNKCKREVKKEWNYCPYCGAKLGFRLPIIFSKKSKDEHRQSSFEREVEKMLQAFGFPNVRINFRTYNAPMQRQQRRVIQRGVRKNFVEDESVNRNVEHIEEPEVAIRRKANEIQVIVSLPSVLSIKDIFIRRLSQSIELRADAGKKMYFKLIPINENSKIIKRNFSGKKLEIILTNK